jgi:phage gp16-like protein
MRGNSCKELANVKGLAAAGKEHIWKQRQHSHKQDRRPGEAGNSYMLQPLAEVS